MQGSLHKIKKLLLSVALLLLLAGGAYAARSTFVQKNLEGPDAPESTSVEEVQKGSPVDSETTFLNIEMPFYSQAPLGNWDFPWQEACEEASVLLVANLYNHMSLNVQDFNTELLRLVDWETEYFGTYLDTNVDQVSEMLDLQYGLKTIIHENPTYEDIQAILDQGHLIIAPFAGKLLGNPNFTNGGPKYHMLVIKGYNAEKNQIVTHDVGTRNGADYVYDWAVLENALHNWNEEDILLGEKEIIEVLYAQSPSKK